jgi:hypothetical protein
VSHRDQWQQAKVFLSAVVDSLVALPREEITRWPEWPQLPAIDLHIPDAYSGFTFTPMKDTLADGTIRVAVQMYRHRFLGIGSMTADGFFIEPTGSIRRFTGEDTWDVT